MPAFALHRRLKLSGLKSPKLSLWANVWFGDKLTNLVKLTSLPIADVENSYLI